MPSPRPPEPPAEPGSPRARAIDGALGLLWGSLALAALTLAGFRLALLLLHGKGPGAYPAADLGAAFLMGARFDLKIAAILLGPVIFLLGAARAVAGPRAPRALSAAGLAWATFALAAVDLLGLVNHFYYRFYGLPIDPLIFGLREDDTAAVLRTVWTDFPVLRAALGLLLLAGLQRALLRRAAALRLPGPRTRALAVVATLALVPFLARGRLGTFPLRDFDLVVSTQPFVNDLVPSGPEALFVAWQQREEGALRGGLDAGLSRLGFRSPLEAAAVLGLPAGSEAELLAALRLRAPENPAARARPPHVVVALMESWGAELLEHHGPGNDLLGRLAPHVARGTLFTRFANAQNFTDGTLEAFLFATPVSPITYGGHGMRLLETSAALPFARRGYRTAFVTSGTGGWRNLSRVLPRQGFAAFHDQHDIEAAFPGAPRHTWGVHDGPMFAFASRLLEEADRKGEPLFLVLLSTTNHPPHAIPADYPARPVDLAAMGRVAQEPGLARAVLQTTQYAADALGGFLDRADAAGIGDRLVLAAFGDHATRGFYDHSGDADEDRRNGVPLLLRVPAPYLGGRTFDAGRFAGPRDLLPTLAALALPGEEVLATGHDLAAPRDRPRALARFDVVLAAEGAVVGLERPVFLGRGPDGRLGPCADAACRAPLERLLAEERAYVGLLDWNIRRLALRPAQR